MSNLMYFGVPGAIAEVRCPESGMGFVDNRDSEITELVSGGRSVYVAPTTYRTFSMSWSANSQKLRHLIDTYNGQYGNGPFYISDPTSEGANVLPARWSNAWQLAHQANGWCKPVVQEWPMAVTPTLTDYKTPYRLVLTQDLAGSLAPVKGVLKTRVIRRGNEPYYFAAKGVATGGAGIRIRGYNKTSGNWVLLTTFTTFTGALSNIISSTNYSYDTIELDFYMPLGSTLTLYGMSLGTQNYAVPGEIKNTNYVPNPRGGLGVTTYWNVSAGTGGTAQVDAYVDKYPYRKNYARNPQGTSSTRFATYYPGTGESGTTTFLTGQSDGPIPQITSYGRWTSTVLKTGGSSGWISTGGSQRTPLAGVSGESVTVAFWIRYIGTGTMGGRLRATLYTTAGTVVNSANSPLTITKVSGQWARVEATVVAAGDFATVAWWFYHTSEYIPSVGSTTDATGVMIEKSAVASSYFDATFPASGTTDYIWEGVVNDSPSLERMPALGPDGRPGFVRYTQTVASTGGSTGAYMRDTTGYNSGVAGDTRYVYAWIRVNMPRHIRVSSAFKTSGNVDVGNSVTPTVTLQPGNWYKFESGPMSATGSFSWFQVWPNTPNSDGVPLPPEFAMDMIAWATDKPIDYYFDGYSPNSGYNYYHWTGAESASASVETDHEAYDYMPVGTGIGAVQMTSSLGGTLVSAVIDRIGLTLDFTEVQNVESRMM